MLEPWIDRNRMEVGCDEAGRGCLAGPVTAAAVVLQPEFAEQLVREGDLNDSKKMTKSKRESLRIEIENNALAWAVTHVSPNEIDRINILNASFAAMRRSVRGMAVAPNFMLIDGNRFRSAEDLPEYGCFVKGDGRFASIAAASVLAKTHRDALMLELHASFPQYGWNANAGYPTKHHRSAIREHGTTPHHRSSFRQLPEEMTLFS
ncbi:MAG: ribonuclease HII [Flavobacteriales bacterium]|nr:ribonuclease HII [Flavobacteriales bacterium]